jgi:hypothetical protein
MTRVCALVPLGRGVPVMASEGDELETVRVEGGVSGSHLITFRCLHHGPLGAVMLNTAANRRRRNAAGVPAGAVYPSMKQNRKNPANPRLDPSPARSIPESRPVSNRKLTRN